MMSNVMMFGLGMIVIGFIWSFLSNFGIEGKLDFETTKDLSALVKPSIYEEKTGHIIRVEVLNGCGVRKLAALYREFLRDQGIDVIRSKNADNSEYEKTIIIRRKGSQGIAEELSRIMGVDPAKIETISSPDAVIDATIIIGQDYDDLTSFKEALHYKEP